MFSPRFRLLALTLPLLLFAGCSTPESEDWLDTIFCWLRPSCLPSQPPRPQTPAKPTISKPLPVRPEQNHTPKSLQKKSESQTQVQESSPENALQPCLASPEIASSTSEQIKRVSYTEPTTQANGETLTDLEKTSIYYYRGDKLIKKLKDCRATTHRGGGRIPQGGGTISVNISEKISPDSKICVNATDKTGNPGEFICEPIRK